MQKAIAALGSAALVALVTIGAANSVQAQDKINLVLGSADNPLWTSAIVAEEHMPKLLDEYSDGRITTERFFGGKLCSEHNCVEQMGQGTVDIAKISLYNVGAFGQTFDFINLPLLWKNADTVKDIFDRWLWDEVRSRAAEELGFHFQSLAFLCGFRQHLNNVRQVKTPADITGIKIRVTKSPIDFELHKSWGAVPVPYDWSQLYMGLQANIVNGIYIPDCHLVLDKHDEVISHATIIDGTWNGQMQLMDLKRFQKYPQWAQDAIARTGRELFDISYELDKNFNESQRAEIEKRGRATIYFPTEAELDLWREASLGAWKAMKGHFDAKLVRRILEEQEGMTKFLEVVESRGLL